MPSKFDHWAKLGGAALPALRSKTPLKLRALAPEGLPAQPAASSDLSSLKLPIPNIGKMPCNRRRRRHHRTHQMRPPPASLSPFEIPVAGRSAAFARLQNVRIHSQTHGASRLPPLKSRHPEKSGPDLPARPPASPFATPARPSLALSSSRDVPLPPAPPPANPQSANSCTIR